MCNTSMVFATDTKAPTSGNIGINKEATYTNSSYVSLDIYAEDEHAIEVWLSNDGVTGTVVDYTLNQTITITDSNYTIGTALTSSNSTTTTNTDNIFRIVN